MSRARTLALAATLAVTAFAAAQFASKAVAAVRSPYSKDYGEGCVMAMTQLLVEQGSYFPPMTGYPYVHGNYPPVFILLNAAAYRVLGPGLAFPRALSVAATLGLLALGYALLRRRGVGVALAACFAGLLIVPWFVQTWAVLARVDMLATALGALGLLLFERWGDRPGWRAHACWPVFVLAAFTKQNALLAPAAVMIALALDRERRRSLAAAVVVFGGLVVLVLAALQLWSHGLALRHLVTYTATADYEWDRMARSYRSFLVMSAPLVALIAAGFLGPVRARGRALYVAYWVLNLLALATIAKAGAGQNYFIEPWLATVLLAGVTAADDEARWPAWTLVAALVALGFDYESGRLPQALKSPERALDFAELQQVVRDTPGPILSENLAVLVVNRKPVQVEPFGFLLLSRHGRLDPAPVVADCRAGRFELVVAEHRLEEIEGLRDCLAERYEPWKQLGPYQLFRPRR